MTWSQYGSGVAIGLAASSLLALALAPIGWRVGWWHYRFAFSWLMPLSGMLALGAIAVALLCLGLGWAFIGPSGGAIALIALMIGACLAYVPWHYSRLRETLPRIHDITTDTDDPPEFAAVLAARTAERAATTVYAGRELAMLQRSAYPDIVPLEVASAAREAFQRALTVAKAMPGWTIVASDPEAGRIEASQSSRWFHFTDDVVIRITPTGAGSRIDMRSLSRQGRSDFGVNAARIRSYMQALRQHLA
jgi:uncharacterized protein (DUF1499 family)